MNRIVALFALLPAGIAAQTETGVAPRASVKPTLVRLAPAAEQRFKVVLAATRLTGAKAPSRMEWSVNDIPGGNTTVGTIDSTGFYRAPSKAPVPHEVCIKAAVEGSSNRYAWATVLVGDASPAYKLVGGWSEPGSSPGRLSKPHGISIEATGNLLIADQTGGRIFRYTPNGKFLAEIGSGPGSDAGQFTQPRFATVDQDGNIYVTDLKPGQPRLQVFDKDGRFLRMFGAKGSEPGQVLRGHGLAFDSRQRLFVTDVDNSRFNAFDRNGKLLFLWGKEGTLPGELNAPHGLYVDPSDDVFVTGYYGPTQKFTSDGHFLLAFAAADPPDGPIYFHSLGGDRFGNAYVVVRTLFGRGQNKKQASVLKYNNNGDYICSISMSRPEYTESWVAIAPDGTLYSLFTTRGKSGVEIFTEE